MKAALALGLGMLLLGFVWALRHSGAGTPAPAEGESLSPRNPEPATRAAPVLATIVDEPGADSASPTVRSPLPQAAPLDPLAALLAAFESETDPDRLSAGLERAAASVSQADLPVALKALSANTSLSADELRQALARRWAENQPEAAAAWVAQLPEGPTCRDLAPNRLPSLGPIRTWPLPPTGSTACRTATLNRPPCSVSATRPRAPTQ